MNKRESCVQLLPQLRSHNEKKKKYQNKNDDNILFSCEKRFFLLFKIIGSIVGVDNSINCVDLLCHIFIFLIVDSSFIILYCYIYRK